MDDIRQRLVKCFVAVFPTINVNHLELLEPTSVEGWDSVATVTLMSVIEEEFEIQIDPENLEAILSFDSALQHVTQNLQNHNGAR
jgi:acyl carrier protein